MTPESRVEVRRPQIALTIRRGFVSRPPTAGPWSKLVAIAVVGIMVVTGFAVLGHAVHESASAPASEKQPEPAKILAGSREATYTIDHMFELYLKSHNPADLGRWNGTMGLNDWWTHRGMLYQEYQARTAFPYVLVYNPYSSMTYPDINQGGSITTWYRLTIDAKNIAEIADGPGLDPIFTPILGDINTPGAYMNISWYGTYLETWELDAIRAGTHYANTYYGVPALVTPRSFADDGYWHELQGKLNFNRAAASKILGLAGAGDLRNQFSVEETNIEFAWFNDWMVEGGPTGAYDIMTAYDYSDDIRWLELYLDPASSADNLVLRFWSVSWGSEFLLTRYMEAANLTRYWQGWPDDWHLNISCGPDGGAVNSRAVIGSHMYATKDSRNNVNGWALEASHLDWCGNSQAHQSYRSPYNAYDPDQTAVTHISWAPLTVNFAKPVSYAYPPMHWNLTAGEKIVVELPSESTSVLGYRPQASISDVLGATKIAEMAGNMDWGEMVIGNGYPSSGTNNLKNFYNAETKTITLVGPLNFVKNWNPSFPGLLETGAPLFKLNVAKVSDYGMEIIGETPPYDDLAPGTQYALLVTAKNITGNTIMDWDGTVDLTSSNITLAETSHVFIASDQGVWQTSFQLVDYGDFSIRATDRTFPQDVGGMIGTVPPNTPPVADFIVTPPTGDTNAIYSFDASSCADAEDPIQALEVRWDWTSDGVFDTCWSTSKTATHMYAMPGVYTVTLEVRDTLGIIAATSQSVVVNPPVPPPVTILKSSKEASNPVVWYYQPIVSGAYSLKIDNTGFKSMVIEVYDVTGGSSTKLFHQTIKFSSYAAYPAGTAISDQCALIANHNYEIVVKDYAGPVGSNAVVYSVLSWSS